MSSYCQDNIKLQKAMTMDLTQIVRVWDVSGLHVECEYIPHDANVLKTAVMKFSEGNILLMIEWTAEGDTATFMSTVAEVSQLEELRERFPHLFELEGTLYAFP